MGNERNGSNLLLNRYKYTNTKLNSVNFFWPLAQRYDVRQKEWHNMPNMLTRRSKHGSVEVDGHLYVVGGYDGQVTLNTVESYGFQAGR